jgi:hypothetical protein
MQGIPLCHWKNILCRVYRDGIMSGIRSRYILHRMLFQCHNGMPCIKFPIAGIVLVCCCSGATTMVEN